MSKTSSQKEYRGNMTDEQKKDIKKLEYINIII